MNIRKPVDFSEMYLSLDMAVAGKYAQMQMYAMIGQAVHHKRRKRSCCCCRRLFTDALPRYVWILSSQSPPDA